MNVFRRFTGGWGAAIFVALVPASAWAQGIEANSNGRISIGSGGRIEINTGNLTTATTGYVELTDNTSVLIVANNITIGSGTTLTSSGVTGTINLGGNWSNSGTFTAGSSTVTFKGSATQTIGGSATTTFYKLTSANTATLPTYSVSDPAVSGVTAVQALDQNMTVQNALAVSSGTFIFAVNTALATQTLTMGTATASGSITVSSGASLWLKGTSSSVTATVTAAGGAGFEWTINVSGILDANYYNFSYIGSSGNAGLTVNSGGKIYSLRNGTFQNGNASLTAYLDLSALVGSDRPNIPMSIPGITFNGSGSMINVKASLKSPIVAFLGGGGTLWGSTYDTDPAAAEAGLKLPGRLLWYTGRIKDLTTGNTFDTITAAITDATTSAGDRIQALAPFVLAETVDFSSASAKSVILEDFTILPIKGPAAYGGASLKGNLHNCAIARGGATYVYLRNSVVFDPRAASTPTTSNCAAYNTIFKEAAPGLSTDVNNLKSATSTKFLDPGRLDFHLTAADGGGTVGPPAGWSTTPNVDFDGNSRPGAAAWDRGLNQYSLATAPKVINDGGGNAINFGAVGRFQYAGTGRGTNTTHNFAYLVGGGGSDGSGGSTGGGDNKLYVVDLTSGQVVNSTAAAGPILYFTFVRDNIVSTTWRVYIFMVVGTQSKGYGDSIQVVVDEYVSSGGDADSMTLHHPTGTTGDADYGNRRFGSVAVSYDDGGGGGVTTHYVYRPGTNATDFKIRWVGNVAEISGDGADANAGISVTSTTNRIKWGRLFFVAYDMIASVNKGALFKVNADPYDNAGAGNPAWGKTWWCVVPATTGESLTLETVWATVVNFDWRGTLTFTFGGANQYLFVPVSYDTLATPTVLVGVQMNGTGAPASPTYSWQANYESGTKETRWGVSLDTNAGAAGSGWATYAMSDGTVVYNREWDAATGSSGIRWASQLTTTSATSPTSAPSCAATRVYPYDFALAGGTNGTDGVVHKIWNVEGSPSDSRNGVSAATGYKVTGGPPPTLTDPSGTLAYQVAGWPLASTGVPMWRIIPAGNSRIYWGTSKGVVYAWNVRLRLSFSATEGAVAGYPYTIPGARVTWIFYSSPTGLLVGTDTGAMYQFTP